MVPAFLLLLLPLLVSTGDGEMPGIKTAPMRGEAKHVRLSACPQLVKASRSVLSNHADKAKVFPRVLLELYIYVYHQYF